MVSDRCAAQVARAVLAAAALVAAGCRSGPPAWTDAFVPTGPADVSNPSFEALTLEDTRTHHALVLLGDTYFFTRA